MPGVIIGGAPYDWDLQSEEESRTYNLRWRVATAIGEGPNYALTAAGMPMPGSFLSYGVTIDPWAFYQRRGSAKLIKQEGSKRYWDVTTVFTTKPARRCQAENIDNPLLEPPRVRGGTNKYQEEVRQDAAGDAILNSAKEPITGLMRDRNRPTVELEMNVSWLKPSVLAAYCDTVNNATWWGMPAYTIKCSGYSWERLLFGTCCYFFKVSFSFEFKYDSETGETWRVKPLDIGNMVLIPGTSTYRRAKDPWEETCRVLLDGAGNATTTPTYLDPVDVYPAKDFSKVGWPAVLQGFKG